MGGLGTLARTAPLEIEGQLGKCRMKSILILLAVAIVQAGCSGRSEPGVDSESGTASREEPVVADPARELELWVRAEDNPPYAFGLAGGGGSSGELRLVILEVVESPGALIHRPVLTSKGEPADFAIFLADSEGHPLLNARALLALSDRSDEGLQRVFIVFEGTIDAGPAHAIGEVLVNLNSLETNELPVRIGRVFSLPVRGSLAGVSLSAKSGDWRLAVNVPAPTGDPSQPVILVYDISPGAKMLDPVDILMVPNN